MIDIKGNELTINRSASRKAKIMQVLFIYYLHEHVSVCPCCKCSLIIN